MTSPAVGTPPSTPAPPNDPSEGDDPQNPAPPAPANPSPPAAPSDPGSGGPPPGNDPNPAPQNDGRMSRAEWDAQQRLENEERERTNNQRSTVDASRDLFLQAPAKLRDELDAMAEKVGIAIPVDLRQGVYDLVDGLLKDAKTGARAALQSDYESDRQTLNDITLAYYGLMAPEERQKFSAEVKGKGPDAWPSTLVKFMSPAIEAKYLGQVTAALRNLLPEEGTHRADFDKDLEGKSSPADMAQAFHDRLVGVVGPSGEPRPPTQRGGGGKLSLAEVTEKRARGEYKSDQDFLKAQNEALGLENL